MRRVTIFCDGATEPINPGGIGIAAAVAFDGDVSGATGATRPAPLVERYAEVGRGAGITNNSVEYRAVRWALRWAAKHCQDADVWLYTDSMLVVNQISGAWQCNKDHLRELRDECREIKKQIPNLIIAWIPRDENDVADALTRKGYREATLREPFRRG